MRPLISPEHRELLRILRRSRTQLHRILMQWHDTPPVHTKRRLQAVLNRLEQRNDHKFSDAEAVREGLAEYELDGSNWPRLTPSEIAARLGGHRGSRSGGDLGAVAWRLVIRPSVQRQLDALDPPNRERIGRALLLLAADPRASPNVNVVQGGGYRLRMGDWRVLYSLDHDEALILEMRVGHRRGARPGQCP
jgi:mRNA interferase RelE/StbE